MIWAALTLIVALAMAGAWACNFTRRQLAAIPDAQQRRLLLRGALLSLGVGAAILVLGVVAFVATGYDWLVLAVIWAVGLLHTGLVVLALHRARKRSGLSGAAAHDPRGHLAGHPQPPRIAPPDYAPGQPGP